MKARTHRPRIALFAADDRTWALPTMERAADALSLDHELVGMYVFPDRLGRHGGRDIPRWYLRTMGPVDCTLLAAFALRRMLDPRTGGTSTWERMSSRLDIPLHRFSNPNLPDVARRIRDDKVDIIVSMVGHILAPEILAAPRIGIVAKHASLLPACRGLFPFLWTRLEGIPVGVSFFVLDKGIDSGRVLLRRRYTADPGQVSMLRFYIDVFHAYPNMLVEALDVLLDEGNAGPIDLPSGYYGLPKRDDLARFRREGGRVARWQDLLYQPEARPEAFEP